MKNSDNKTFQYYDPEIVSLLLTALSALGSTVSVIYCLIDHRHAKRISQETFLENEHRRESIRKELNEIFCSLLDSVKNIQYELENLERLYAMSIKAVEDSEIKFGNGSMWLNQFQFNCFYRIQIHILSEIHSIFSSLRLMEELLASGEKYTLIEDLGYSVKSRHLIEESISTINDTISRFGCLSINEFHERSIRICRQIEFLIEQLQENLRRIYE